MASFIPIDGPDGSRGPQTATAPQSSAASTGGTNLPVDGASGQNAGVSNGGAFLDFGQTQLIQGSTSAVQQTFRTSDGTEVGLFSNASQFWQGDGAYSSITDVVGHRVDVLTLHGSLSDDWFF